MTVNFKFKLCIFFLLGLLISAASAQEIQKSPGQATLFAEGVISTGNGNDELFATFSPNGKTIFFVRRVPGGVFTIYTSKFESGKWDTPQVAEFSGKYKDQGLFMSPDGKRLYFNSNRPKQGTEPSDNDDIWFVERKNEKWSKPQNLGFPINTSGNERNMSVDNKGTLYFWVLEELPNGKGASDIYRSRLVNGKYTKPENRGDVINSKYYEANPSIAPDGSYLLFTSDDRPDGFGKSDIYIRYNHDGVWAEPKNLGTKVNSSAFDFSPRISPDGKYLFFSSNRNVDGEGMGKQNIYYIPLDSTGLEITPGKTRGQMSNKPSSKSKALEIYYLANEGFFINSPNAKVLVDALYREGVEGYKTIPQEILGKLEKAQSPFDKIDLILASHYHDDHFDPLSVKEHLASNSSAVFVSTPQAAEKLSAVTGGESLQTRMIAALPKEAERKEINHRGINLQILNLHHGRNRPVENLGFLFTVNGQKILHVGDTEANAADFKLYNLAKEKIDIAFLPYWYFLNESVKKIVREDIRAKYLIVMHVPAKENEDGYIRRLGGWDAVLGKIKAEFPNAFIFSEPMEKRVIGNS